MKHLFASFPVSCALALMLFFRVTDASAQSAIITGPDAGSGVIVNTYSGSGSSTGAFFGAGAGFSGGVRVGAGDVNGDGAYDIITGEGAGADGSSRVRVYTGPSRTLLYSFNPFAANYTGGAFVAGGDVNRDGRADIIVGAGTGSTVKVFSGSDGVTVLRNFLAFNPAFTGGVQVASGDVNGDGYADIIAAQGAGGTGQVSIFSGQDLSLIRSFNAFGNGYSGGVFVGTGDVNRDGFSDIVLGAGTGFAPRVLVLSGADNAVLKDFNAFDPSSDGGVRVAAADLNGDGFADLIAGQGPGDNSLVRAFNGQSLLQLALFQPYGDNANGVFVIAVPEPGTVSLVALGCALGFLGLRLRRKAA